mmetsp:Transcript_19151/g.49059  ORF Transcript_19151/g.49059 Transcript_19151/m.49059 type:complete len:85 (-) Transcript_19151:1479-1733(-)
MLVWCTSNSVCLSLQPPSLHELKVPRKMDDVEIVDEEDAGDAFAAYYADESKTGDREPVFHEGLGLCIEQLRDDYSVDQLWSVL